MHRRGVKIIVGENDSKLRLMKWKERKSQGN